MLNVLIARLRRWHMTTLKPFGTSKADRLRLTLGDINAEIAQCLAVAFSDVADVEVICGNLLDASCDGIVSPANSFGDMGGGIDKAIDDFHRGEAQRLVMAAIAEQFYGELPVGAALVVELRTSRFPFVVAAPTMRIPGGVEGSINAYLSMRAALVAVLKHNATGARQIRSLAVSGLGTGVGGLGSKDAAEQMRAAYDNVVGGTWRHIFHAAQAPFALGLRRITASRTASNAIQPRQQAYLQILEWGIISLRNRTHGELLELCEIEADHLHNLPSLFDEPNEARHQYYIVAERSLYIERVKKLGASEYLESMMRRYAEPWNALALIAGVEMSE